MNKRILAIDPGSKNIGLAISDLSSTIARPLEVLRHQSKVEDIRRILEKIEEFGVTEIVVGCPLDIEGNPGPQARLARQLIASLREASSIPVIERDEWGTTKQARQVRKTAGVKRQQRQGHLDSVAAALLLQDYLNEVNDKKSDEEKI